MLGWSGDDFDEHELLGPALDGKLLDLADAADEVLVVEDVWLETGALLRLEGLREVASRHLHGSGEGQHLELILGVSLEPLLPELPAHLGLRLHEDAGLGA